MPLEIPDVFCGMDESLKRFGLLVADVASVKNSRRTVKCAQKEADAARFESSTLAIFLVTGASANSRQDDDRAEINGER